MFCAKHLTHLFMVILRFNSSVTVFISSYYPSINVMPLTLLIAVAVSFVIMQSWFDHEASTETL